MFSNKVSNKDLLVLFNCLERYDNTGLSPQNAIQEFCNVNPNKILNDKLNEVCKDLRNGYFLSGALEKHPEIFPAYCLELLKVGEKTGDTNKVYLEIINYLDEQIKIESSMKSALMMPKIFGVLIVFILIGYVFFVLPRITQQLSQMDAEVPLITRMLINFGELAVNYWFLWLLFAAAGYIGFRISCKRYPLFYDFIRYRLPVFGELYSLQLNYQFTKLIAICYSADVDIRRSLSITSSAISSPCMKKCLDNVVAKISRQGADFIKALQESDEYKLLNPFLYPLLSAGVISDSLGKVLADESDRCVRRINLAIKKVEEKVGNLVLIPIWSVLILVMLAIVLPLLSMIEKTGSKIISGGL